MSRRITVVLADDHGVLRDGLSAVLNTQPDIEVVGLAANGREAVQTVAAMQPDVAILDIVMPELNGLLAAGQISRLAPDTRLIMLSMHLTDEHIRSAFQAGALGYILKESAGEEVIEAVRSVAAGQRFLSPQIPAMLLDSYTRPDPPSAPSLTALTDREQEVLQLLVEGYSNADIAARLVLSPKTVHTYRARIMNKLDIHDLPGLVRFAIQHGLITL